MKKDAPPVLTRSISGWGVSARVEASDDDMLARCLAALPDGFAISSAKGNGPLFKVRRTGAAMEVTAGRTVRFAGTSKRGFTHAIADAFETLASTRSRSFAFLHAGGVEIEGRALLLPGRSHAGKSTLVAALLKRGAAYLSDDMLPIDSRLRAHPFPRPLGIRAARGQSPTRTPLRRLGAVAATHPLPVAMVWAGAYEAGATRLTFERRPGVAGFAELLAQAPGAQIRPDLIIPRLTSLAAGVPVFAGVRGDADAAAEALIGAVRSLGR